MTPPSAMTLPVLNASTTVESLPVLNATIDMSTPVFNDSNILQRSRYTNCYATLISSTDLLPAFEAFIYSLQLQVDSITPIMVVALENIGILSAKSVLSKYPWLQWELYVLSRPSHSFAAEKTLPVSILKLSIWRLERCGSILYMDPGVLVLKNLDAAFRIPFDRFLGSLDWGKEYPLTLGFHGSVFLTKPSFSTYLSLAKSVDMMAPGSFKQSLSEVFKFYFGYNNVSCCLPSEYNIQKTVIRHWPDMWNFTAIRVLTFVGEKPWASWSAPLARDNAPASLKLQFMSKDSWDSDLYTSLHSLWKEYYMNSRNQEFNSLIMYVGYHDTSLTQLLPNTLKELPRVVHVCLGSKCRRKGDLHARRYIKKLSDPLFQSQVGEFGTVLAALRHAESPLDKFIGVASWKYHIKSNTREAGCSLIDWTKVDFRSDTVYFWCGVYSQNFYDFQEQIHPGITKLLSEVSPVGIPVIQPGYHVYTGSFIASKEVVRRYSHSVRTLIQNMYTRYPRINSTEDFCPINAKKYRCIGYVLERFLNLWIANSGIETIFAVDGFSTA